MAGLVAHPWEGLDVYAYYGVEQVDANFFNVGTTLFGLGNPGFSNATCLVTTPFSFAGNTTVGFWQNAYKGDYGRVAFGAQYEYIKRKARHDLSPVLSVLTDARAEVGLALRLHGPDRQGSAICCDFCRRDCALDAATAFLRQERNEP